MKQDTLIFFKHINHGRFNKQDLEIANTIVDKEREDKNGLFCIGISKISVNN